MPAKCFILQTAVELTSSARGCRQQQQQQITPPPPQTDGAIQSRNLGQSEAPVPAVSATSTPPPVQTEAAASAHPEQQQQQQQHINIVRSSWDSANAVPALDDADLQELLSAVSIVSECPMGAENLLTIKNIYIYACDTSLLSTSVRRW